MEDTHDNQRRLSALDRLLTNLQQRLPVDHDSCRDNARPAPVQDPVEPAELSTEDRQHAAGLMRVNHAGEVAAQALYQGQAATAHDPGVRQHLLQAAAEEQDHLDWCLHRLTELDAKPSLLDPLWYAGSYAIGAAAGMAGDSISLGFVAETESQVAAHLQEHLDRLPKADSISRAIVEQMHADETRHGQEALDLGGIVLPAPIQRLMRLTARVMTRTAYHF